RGEFSDAASLTQDELARHFGVSRIPVREALRRLEAEGLIILHANRRTTITRVSVDDAREIYELRMLLEGDLIQRAVSRYTASQLRHLKFLHESLGHAEEAHRQDRLNREFHAALYSPAGRPRQQAMVENLRNLIERYQNATLELMRSTDR